MTFPKAIAAIIVCLNLTGCSVIAVADAIGSSAIYTGKTLINVVDAVTPDIINKKKSN
jgi:hypothetical protein